MPTMGADEDLKLLLGLDRASIETLPVDPRWTFADAMNILAARHSPTSLIHNQGRNRLVEAWATMVGGQRALDDLNVTIASYGSLSATARALRTSADTLKMFQALFAALPEPHQIFPGFGVFLFFVGHLGSPTRHVVEAIKQAVLGNDSACHLTRFEEVSGGTLMRFDGGQADELERLAAAFTGWTWQDELGALTSPTTARLLSVLEEIQGRLARVELRLPGEDVVEWMCDEAQKHLGEKDRQLVQTSGQRLARRATRGIAKRLLSEVGLDTLLDGDDSGG